MSTLSRHREDKKQRLTGLYGDIDALYGDQASDAGLATGILSELVKSAGGLAQTELQKKATKAARKKADDAKKAAASESDPNGPLHKAAADAEAAAVQAESGKASSTPAATGPGAGGYAPQSASQGFFTPVNVLIGVGIIGAGMVAYKMLGKR